MAENSYDSFTPNDIKMEILTPPEVECTMPIPIDKRIGTRMLTKFERIRVIGHRAEEIALGGPIYVDCCKGMTPYETAEMELKQKKITVTIRRYFPDGSHEDWRVDELLLP